MTIDRALNSTAVGVTSTQALDSIDDTVNWLSGLDLGFLENVAGTNALTATLSVENGFSSPSDNARAVITPPNDTTDAVTLQIQTSGSPSTNLGAEISVRDETGAALTSTRYLRGGNAYIIQYDATAGYWKTLSYIPAAATGGGDNYVHAECFSSSGSWTAPFKCKYQIWAFGGGGGGANRTGTGGTGGGGAGGSTMLEGTAESGLVLTITVGAAGAAGGTNGSGSSGGNTTVVGTGISLTANGGGGGNTSGVGGTGGSASGGDFNYAGGDGGGTTGSHYGSGGAVGLIRDGIDGTTTTATVSTIRGAGLHASSYTTAGYIGANLPPFSVDGVLGGDGTGDGGNFCGGGGGYGSSGAAAGDGGIGAGGGSYGGTSSGGAGGAGGSGMVLIRWTSEIT